MESQTVQVFRSFRAQAIHARLKLLRQGMTFGVVGLTATLVHVTVALLIRERLGLAPLTANLIAYCTAVGVSYFGNACLTFRTRAWHGRQFASFAVTSLSALALNQAIVYIAVNLLHLPFPVALALVILIVTPATFVMNRLWVFARA